MGISLLRTRTCLVSVVAVSPAPHPLGPTGQRGGRRLRGPGVTLWDGEGGGEPHPGGCGHHAVWVVS